MSTLLIDTNGGSVFSTSTDLVDPSTQLGSNIKNNSYLNKFSIALTNADNKPVLKPTSQAIDVINDFSWYAGPKATSAALDKVPCVFLTEREQLLSSLISGALYYLNASAAAVKAVGESDYVKSVLGRLSEKSGDALNEAGREAGAALDSFRNIAGGTATDRALLSQHNLKSLEGIYFTKPTGFQYRLPIYGSPTSTTGQWSTSEGERSGGGAAGKNSLRYLVQAGQAMAQEAVNLVNFAQPGVYIEKPQYFQAVKGRTETVTFPLVNTVRRGTHSPVQQNYELLWLLAFQNKAYKTDFARTPPPKIYSVNVPGQFSMPYAFISGMKVDFIGTTRKTSVFVPSGNGEGVIGSKQITTPVPEAYQVSLTFTSLIGEYGNTMLSDAFTTSIIDNKVTIGNVGNK
tara:strand:+ start:699 stop:1904 length:1206 start_codon:yes stop_codon:yes gene_type:complete